MELLPNKITNPPELVTMKDFAQRVKSDGADSVRNCRVVARGVLMNPVHKAVTGPFNVLRIQISDQSADRSNDVIHQDGWDFSNYEPRGNSRGNPIVTFGHDYEIIPVGRDQGLEREGDLLIGNPGFVSRDIYELSHTVYQCSLAGLLNAASVGFMPKKWTFNEERGGFDLFENELYEYAICPLPDNPRCLYLAEQKGINLRPIAEWCEKAMAGLFGAGCWISKADLEAGYFIGVGGKKILSIPRYALKGIAPDDVRTALTAPGAAICDGVTALELRALAPLPAPAPTPASATEDEMDAKGLLALLDDPETAKALKAKLGVKDEAPPPDPAAAGAGADDAAGTAAGAAEGAAEDADGKDGDGFDFDLDEMKSVFAEAGKSVAADIRKNNEAFRQKHLGEVAG